MLSTAAEAVTARSVSVRSVNDLGLDRADLLGYRVAAASVEACVDSVRAWILLRDKTRYLVCLNPHSAYVASHDAEFHRALLAADLVIPDGIGVVWASHLLRAEIRSRVTGFDIFWGLSTALQQHGGGRYFFLGSDEPTLKAVRKQMSLLFPSIEVVGTHAPPFADDFTNEESVRMIEIVNQAQPDVLWLGLSAPKQEKWVFRNREAIRVPVAAPIGAVFDYFSGTKQRPSRVVRWLGLEWFVRLCREPTRLWRRSFVSAPAFAAQVVAARMRSRGARR